MAQLLTCLRRLNEALGRGEFAQAPVDRLRTVYNDVVIAAEPAALGRELRGSLRRCAAAGAGGRRLDSELCASQALYRSLTCFSRTELLFSICG